MLQNIAHDLWTEQVFWSIAILVFAALLQSIAGFGAALVGLPLLIIAGNQLFQSQIMLLCAILPQNVFACWRLRKSIDYREVAVPAAIRLAAMPVGVMGLSALMMQSEDVIGQVVGGVIVLALVLQACSGIQFTHARRWPWMLLTFGGSGLLQGVSGIGGPPMVLWVYGQKYSVDRARAFLFAIYVSNFLPQMISLYLKFGSPIWKPALIGMITTPLVVLAAELGLRIGTRVGDNRVRRGVLCALALLAAAMILRPYW